MRRQPDALFIVDLRKEQLAVREARRLGVPVIGLVDTNCDPDEADYVIPGNDDAIRSCSLIVRAVADAVEAGRQRVAVEEFRRSNGAEAPAGRGGSAAEAGTEEPEEAVAAQAAEPAAAAPAAPTTTDAVEASPEADSEQPSQPEAPAPEPGAAPAADEAPPATEEEATAE